MLKAFFILFFLSGLLFSEIIDTFYGPIEVQESVLIELVKCPAMQRLKEIHQYGVAYYTTHREEYSRYDHSLGVFAILRKNGASLEEQISGLLHDISHTVFSHVGDWIFGKEYQENDYQSFIYKFYLSLSGVEEILLKHGFTINQILPRNEKFIMLEQPLPNLCADRIDYNIQGAYFQGFITKKEALELYEDLQFMDGCWIGHSPEHLKKLARFSFFMTENCWSSMVNYSMSRWLGDAILRGLEIGILSWKEIHFGYDNTVWNKLRRSKDNFIQKKMFMIDHPQDFYSSADPKGADINISFRCRGIDPWVLQEGKIVRLTSLDTALAQELEILKKKALEGLNIKFINTFEHSFHN